MKKLAKNKWVDHMGHPLKMPKTFQQLAELVRTETFQSAKRAEDHVLYLQGLNKDRFGNRDSSFIGRRPTAMVMEDVIQQPVGNARQDIVRALADLGTANAKIAYSLMRALEGSK